MKFTYKVTGKFLKLSKGKIMNGVMVILPYTLCIWFLLVFLSSTKSVFQTNPKAIQEHRFKDWAVQKFRLGNLNLLIILNLCGFGRSQQKAELTSPQNRCCEAVFSFDFCHALCGKMYFGTESFAS